MPCTAVNAPTRAKSLKAHQNPRKLSSFQLQLSRISLACITLSMLPPIPTLLPSPIDPIAEILSDSDPLFQHSDSASGCGEFAMGFRALSLLAVLLLAVPALAGRACDSYKRVEKTEIFLSPSMVSRPGDVNHKFFYLDAPTGHFATVDFNAQLVYANGDPAPLSEIYLHHWNLIEIATHKERDVSLRGGQEVASWNSERLPIDDVPVELVVNSTWTQGGEARRLNSSMPWPYGLVSGGDGVKTRWLADVHGIDIRGVLHPLACTECRCDLYTGGNRTALPEHYSGGFRCCVDESRCKLRDDFNGDDSSMERTFHLKYTWTYIAYDECVIPLSHVRLDVTTSPQYPYGAVEYDVEGSCKPEDVHKPECIQVNEVTTESKLGGDIVHAISHLHTYCLDSLLFGEDGRLICQSTPIYGHGNAAGDENGYVVKISHCNPSLGANGLGKIRKGEKLRYQVKYSKVDGPHTGVMGILFLKIAEETKVITTPVVKLSSNRKVIN